MADGLIAKLEEICGLELKLARMDVNLDLYRFTELYYVVLSMPVDVRKRDSSRQ